MQARFNEGMKSLAQRVKAGRARLDVTQTELAKLAGLDQTDISKIERGAIRKTTAIPSLARALQCDPFWLQTGEGSSGWDNQNNTANGPEVRGVVPLISWVQAGHWADIVDNFATGDAEAWLETTARLSPRSFALRIVGDSMSPKVPDGSIVIFDPDRDYHHGSLVLAKRTGDQQATFKQLWYDGTTPYLKPLNERFPMLDMPQDSRILAVAVRLELDLT
jgi:SOS-response transcriptional repressor LexA